MDRELLEQVKEAILKYNEGDTVNFSNKQFIQWLKQLIEMIEGLQRENEQLRNDFIEMKRRKHVTLDYTKDFSSKLKIAEEALEKIQICSTIHLAFDITDKALSRIRAEN